MQGTNRIRTAGLVLAASLLGAIRAQALDNSDCFVCHDDKALARKGPGGKTVSLFVAPARYRASVHGSNTCTSCHADITEAPHPDRFKAKPAVCASCHPKATASFNASVHGTARQAGKTEAAHCADCHGTHFMEPLGAAASPLQHANLGATCGRCHPKVLQEVLQSVHGKALAAGIRDAPVCTDCHFDHRIEDLRKTSPMRISEQVCSRCHASDRLNTRYSLPTDRVRTFFDSYHGLAARLGSTRAANCASCHGFHSILPSSDPRSAVHKANMVRTCQKCHPEANEKFSSGRIHLRDDDHADIGSRISAWVRRIYMVLIVAVIGGMLVHNALVLRKKMARIVRNRKRTVVRMPRALRIQHLLLLVSFIALAVTGFALKFPDSAVAMLVGSNEAVRRLGHRLAAVIMMGLAVYHTVYVAAARDGRKLLRDFLPGAKDVRDVFANILYLILPGAARPRFGRFGYAEKAEYWAVVWGTVIMGITGLLIWFKSGTTQWLPRWVIEVATTIHYYEAILAVLAIVVWHFYHVIFDPDVYPINMAWWDGKVPEDWYHEEHPLDHETPGTRPADDRALSDAPNDRASTEGAPGEDRRPPRPSA